ncbi:MAG: hypothetical protein GY869_09915 [Planctomycetes bacterium]|nr:hypothetical protein [Planctomycetota bacterium]
MNRKTVLFATGLLTVALLVSLSVFAASGNSDDAQTTDIQLADQTAISGVEQQGQDCENCTDCDEACEECTDCETCEDCDDCKDCKDCKDCLDCCVNCDDCDDCDSCTDGKTCQESMSSGDCCGGVNVVKMPR